MHYYLPCIQIFSNDGLGHLPGGLSSASAWLLIQPRKYDNIKLHSMRYDIFALQSNVA